MARYKTDKNCKACGSRLEYSYTFFTYLCPKCNKVYELKDLEND